jgi:hypothetical protein
MRSCFCAAAIFAVAVVLAACSSDKLQTAEVSGVVRLDGQPLAQALVQFVPEQGRLSMATTDDAGHYELAYSGTRTGALIGKHTVRISTWRAPDGDRKLPGAPERVPTKYNTKTELTQEVKAGANVIDFDLDGKGKIVQPK